MTNTIFGSYKLTPDDRTALSNIMFHAFGYKLCYLCNQDNDTTFNYEISIDKKISNKEFTVAINFISGYITGRHSY